MLKKLFSVHLPLFTKIFISSVALVVLLSISISITMNLVIQNLLSDEIIKYYTSYLNKLDSNLTYITQKIDHLIDNTVFVDDITELETLSTYNRYKVMNEVTAQLSDIMIYSNISGITLIVDGKRFVRGQYYSDEYLMDESVWPEDTGVYRRQGDRDSSYITFLKRVKIDNENDGLMIILISPLLMDQSLDGAGVFALDSNSDIVWMKNIDRSNAEEFVKYYKENEDSMAGGVETIGENRYITLKSGTGHVEMVMCLENNILEKKGDEILKYIIIMTLGIILLCVIFSWILSRTITTRINVLKNKMQNFELNTHIEEGKTGISLKKKIMLYYIAVCFLPITVMSGLYYNLSMGIMEEEIARVFEQSIGHIGDNMLMATDGFVIDGRYIANDEYVQDVLSGRTEPDSEKIESLVKIATKDNGCENLVMYNNNGEIIYSLKNGVQEKLEGDIDNICWLAPDYDEFNQKVAGVIIPINGNDYRKAQYMHRIGYLKIVFKENVFKDIITLNDSNGAKTYMLNANNEIIVSDNFEDIGKNIEQFIDDKKIICEYIINDSWKLCGVVQTEMLFSNRAMILLYLMLIYVLVLLLLVIFSSQISRIIITPMKILNNNIQDNMQNRAKSRIHLKTGDEIEELCKSFNIMNDEIDRLVNDVYEAEMAKKELEVQSKEASLNALQAQINPHFLYNTFETTNWLIMQNQNEEAVNMINRLSDIFRLGINRGKNTFSLRMEIKQAQAYIDIQKMRYAEKLCVVWEYEDSLLDCMVVKTILQPILENAIYHGIEPKEDGGEIEISIDKNGDRLEISVIDTGVGIEAGKCAMINSDLSNNENKILKSIGLKNVNDRIKLMYGEDYGIRVESVLGKYTEVIMSLPYIEEEGDSEQNV